jgi:SagB-type dehydrogenase family enzyme
MKLKVVLFSVMFMAAIVSRSTAIEPVSLPEPEKDGGRPLMQALNDRRTMRSYSPEPLPEQVLSNLLWAAFGVNRSESGKRTAPSAVNWQEIDIYVSLADGLFLYNAVDHALDPILMEDIREATGLQGFVKDAPVNLVFVADYSRMGGASEEDKDFYSAADTGFISQNVYLFCASEGLATVVRGYLDRSALHEKMGLRPDQKVVLAQTVGYPVESEE